MAAHIVLIMPEISALNNGVNHASLFRTEIQGLRAIAVLAVIFFHANFEFIPGGFLGVDIFFVISGYLITSNILKEVSRDSFSFLVFYRRRFLRLFPAVTATIIVTLALSFVLLPPDQVMSLSESALAALFAFSNIYFWSEIGYFDAGAHLKPLLHTWSLGVEEQFYLVWPATLIILTNFLGKKGIPWLIFIIGLASLYGAYRVFEFDQGAVFYLMPFRIFEFAIGIMLAFPLFSVKPSANISGVLSVVGFVLLFYAFVFFDSNVPMPGVYSLLPCLATAFIIYAGNSKANISLLSNPVMIYVGQISYSLYLVHWPVALFITQAGFGGRSGKLLVVAISFVAALILFYAIEQPLRSVKKSNGMIRSNRSRVLATVLLISLAGSLIVFSQFTEGLRFRLSEVYQALPTAHEMWEERGASVRIEHCFLAETKTFSDFEQDVCLAVDQGKKNYLIIGDSLAADLYSSLSQAYPAINFLQATSGNCSQFIGNDIDKNCKDLKSFIFEIFIPRHSIDGVILSGNIGFEFDSIEKTIAYLKTYDIAIILAGPPVRFSKDVPTLIFESGSSDVDDIEKYVFLNRHPADQVNPLLVEKYSKSVTFIDLHKAMCVDGCELFTESGRLIYLDYAHLTKAGSAFQAEKIRKVYPDLFEE